MSATSSALTFYETRAYTEGARRIAGIDEVGRGALAGPVVAAAVMLPQGYENENIRDSKKLSPARREVLYRLIMDQAVAVGVGVVSASVIDRINILQATLLAMQRAADHLNVTPDLLLIDGNQPISSPLRQWTIVQGDALSISIAAASIIAKVTRDRMMVTYDRDYPSYGFALHKGYGTETHREAIRVHGPSLLHRRSFRLIPPES